MSSRRVGAVTGSSMTTSAQARVDQGNGLAEYQVMAIDASGIGSFLSEPIRVVPPDAVILVEPSKTESDTTQAGAGDNGSIELSLSANTEVQFTVEIPVAGMYAIDARYANGSGPINTGDKAAMRSLVVDGARVGSLVMPHRGADLWTDWGYSSVLTTWLSAGPHALTLAYTPVDRNMNGAVNTALLDHLRLTKLAEP